MVKRVNIKKVNGIMKKSILKFFLILIGFLIILIGYFNPNSVKQRDAIKEFNRKKEVYNHVKNFLLEKLEDLKNSSINIRIDYNNYNKEWYYSYYGEKIEKSETYDISDKNIIDSLNLLREVEGTSFDKCSAGSVSGYAVINFIYDWERAFDRDYMITWCEDLKMLKKYIQSHTLPETEYILKKLGDDWYYIGWK